MKRTIMTLAAAAAISLGAAGAASAGTMAPAFGNEATAQNGAAVQLVRHGYGYGYNSKRCRYLYYKGFVQGFYWAKRAYFRYCRPHGQGYGNGYGWFCKRLYYKAFVLGMPGAKYKYYKLCRRHYGYGYGR